MEIVSCTRGNKWRFVVVLEVTNGDFSCTRGNNGEF